MSWNELIYSLPLSSQDAVIGVHCTHGVNRTGYLVCRYLIQKMGWDPEAAIAGFSAARGHPIERQNYLQDLKWIKKKVTARMEQVEEDILARRMRYAAAAWPSRTKVKEKVTAKGGGGGHQAAVEDRRWPLGHHWQHQPMPWQQADRQHWQHQPMPWQQADRQHWQHQPVPWQQAHQQYWQPAHHHHWQQDQCYWDLWNHQRQWQGGQQHCQDGQPHSQRDQPHWRRDQQHYWQQQDDVGYPGLQSRQDAWHLANWAAQGGARGRKKEEEGRKGQGKEIAYV